MEVFYCFNVVALPPANGGLLIKNTCAVIEMHIRDQEKFKGLFLALGTKYERTVDGNYIFVKTERDTSFRQVIVIEDLLAPVSYTHLTLPTNREV